MYSLDRLSVLALLSFLPTALSQTQSSVSLSNFTPRIDNLPPTCNIVYTQPVPGCTAADFTNGARCSKGCINGLIQISQQINNGCKDVDVAETSIIGVFLLGQGIPALCPGIQVTTINQASSTAAATSAAATSSAAQTTTAGGGIIVDTSSPAPPPPPSTLETSVATPEVSVLPSAATTAAPPPGPTFGYAGTSTSSTSKKAKATSTASAQKSNQESGGGSPFDVQAVSSARRWDAAHAAVVLGSISLPLLLTWC